MHEFLDGELSYEDELVLKEHLQKCPDCQKHFQELKRTEAYIKSVSHIQTSDDFTSKVLASLPKEKRMTSVKRWFKHHPMLTAAAVFLIFMIGSLVNGWADDQKFSFTKQPNLVVENNTVIVPEGEVIKGDIVVKNGNIRIEGEVEGNVTIINGEQYLASAGKVTGEIHEINELFEWLWFKIKEGVKNLVDVFNNEGDQ